MIKLLNNVKSCCDYYRLKRIGNILESSREIINYITPVENINDISYEICEINSSNLGLNVSTDTERILEISILNGIPVLTVILCSIDVSGISQEFIVQTIVNACEITSDYSGIGAGTLKLTELGRLMLYISMPTRWNSLRKEGIKKAISKITEVAHGVILPELTKELKRMRDMEALMAENNIDENMN